MASDEGDRTGPLDPDEAFAALEPPPGGLAALRARLAGEEVAHRRRLWGPLTALAAAAGVVVLGLGREVVRPPARLLDDRALAEHFSHLVALRVAAAPAEPVTALAGGRPVPLRLLVRRPEVVVYLAQPARRSSGAARP
jgi:hypothetical protein